MISSRNCLCRGTFNCSRMRLCQDFVTPAEALCRVFNLRRVSSTVQSTSLQCLLAVKFQRRLYRASRQHAKAQPTEGGKDRLSRLEQMRELMKKDQNPESSTKQQPTENAQQTQGHKSSFRAPGGARSAGDTGAPDRSSFGLYPSERYLRRPSAPNDNLYTDSRTRDPAYDGHNSRDDVRGPPSSVSNRYHSQRESFDKGPLPQRRESTKPFVRAYEPFPDVTYDEAIGGLRGMRQEIRVLEKGGPPGPPLTLGLALERLRTENARIEAIDIGNLTEEDLKTLHLDDYRLEDFKLGNREPSSVDNKETDQDEQEDGDETVKRLPPMHAAKKAKLESTMHLVQISKPEETILCKVVTVGELRRAAREKARTQKKQKKKREVWKQIDINWAVDLHDLSNKLNQLESFLEHGKKVELVLAGKRSGKRKARKATLSEAQGLIQKIKEKMAAINATDFAPMEGKMLEQISWKVQSKAKKK